MTENVDVAVIGGGAAGLSGAVALARSRRSVVVIDAGEPRNATAGHVHNYLTRDGATPAELSAAGREEVLRYGGRLVDDRVVDISRDGGQLVVRTAAQAFTAGKLLVATGATDQLPDIAGLRERWGVDVLHCPYCHGWEVRDQRVAVLANSTTTTTGAMHQVQLFRQLTEHVTLLQHTGQPPTGEQAEQLAAKGVAVVTGEVVEVESDESGLRGVRLADGSRVALDALVVGPVCRARADLLTPLGVTTSEVRFGDIVMGEQVDADPMGRTSAEGVWVAGNVANVQAQVITSAAAGLAAGAAINAELVAADTARAVEEHRLHGRDAWDARYRERDHAWTGDPNAALVTEVADLPPGTALDAGSGEGGDAIWLARQGWTVTAADHSSVALERARAAGAAAGVAVDWQQLDLTRDAVPGGPYDLVTSAFLHMPADRRRAAFARLAAAVAPGGTLVVLGHDPSDEHSGMPRPGLAEFGWTAPELAASLGDGWTVLTCEPRARQARGHDGEEVTIRDAVLRARRD